MRQDHQAGERMFVDYVGGSVGVVDRETGDVRQVQVFMAILGASCYTYAEYLAHYGSAMLPARPEHVGRHLEAYRDRFGRLPPYFAADPKCGTRMNHMDLETLTVRLSSRLLGRKVQQRRDSWFKKK